MTVYAYLTMLPVTQTMEHNNEFAKDMEGGNHGLIWSAILAFTWRHWTNPWEDSVILVTVRAEILNMHLLNVNQKHYSLSQGSNRCSLTIWNWKSTTVDTHCDTEKTKFLRKFLAKNMHSNGWLFKCQIFYSWFWLQRINET